MEGRPPTPSTSRVSMFRRCAGDPGGAPCRRRRQAGEAGGRRRCRGGKTPARPLQQLLQRRPPRWQQQRRRLRLPPLLQPRRSAARRRRRLGAPQGSCAVPEHGGAESPGRCVADRWQGPPTVSAWRPWPLRNPSADAQADHAAGLLAEEDGPLLLAMGGPEEELRRNRGGSVPDQPWRAREGAAADGGDREGGPAAVAAPARLASCDVLPRLAVGRSCRHSRRLAVAGPRRHAAARLAWLSPPPRRSSVFESSSSGGRQPKSLACFGHLLERFSGT